MAGAPIPINEAQRQLQVTQLCRLDTTPDEVFEHIVSMVAEYFQAPIALISSDSTPMILGSAAVLRGPSSRRV